VSGLNERLAEIMETYSSDDYKRIAAAVGRDIGEVVEHKQLFTD
jgi:hypothetical protein